MHRLSLTTHALFHVDTHIYIYTFTHPSCTPADAHALLLSLTEVIAEVVVARWFWDDWRALGNGNVLEVQEAELNLHRQEDLQLAAHGFTAHLSAQEDAQSICPQAELRQRERKPLIKLFINCKAHRKDEAALMFADKFRARLTSVLEGAMKFRLYSSTSYVMLNARSSTSWSKTGKHSEISTHERWTWTESGNTEFADLVLFAFILLHVRTVFSCQQPFDVCYGNWGRVINRHGQVHITEIKSGLQLIFMIKFCFASSTSCQLSCLDSLFSWSVSIGGFSVSSSTSP